MKLKAYYSIRRWNADKQAYENIDVVDTRNSGLSTLKEAFYYNPKLHQNRRHSPAWSLGFIYGLRIGALRRKVQEAESFLSTARKMRDAFGPRFVQTYFGKDITSIENEVWELGEKEYQYSNTIQTSMNLGFQGSEAFFAGLGASENVPV